MTSLALLPLLNKKKISLLHLFLFVVNLLLINLYDSEMQYISIIESLLRFKIVYKCNKFEVD